MQIFRHTKTVLAFGLALQVVIATQTATVAQAQMISTDTAIERAISDMDRAYLLNELQRAEVQDELIELGVSPDEAERRLAALSDEEVSRMLLEIQDGQAGAGIATTIGTIFIILLITDILCITQLFSFVRCVR